MYIHVNRKQKINLSFKILLGSPLADVDHQLLFLGSTQNIKNMMVEYVKEEKCQKSQYEK